MRPDGDAAADRDDPRRLRSAGLNTFFVYAMRRQLQASFHAVRLALPGVHAVTGELPLVVYFNHPSWWDAALLPVLCSRLWPARRAFAPIDAEALRRYPFMRRIGLFPVQAGRFGSTAAFLRIGGQLLADPSTVFCITPEAAFTDARLRPLSLRPGLAALLARVPRATVLPLALEYPFWNERTPEALLRFGAPLLLGRDTGIATADTQRLLQQHLTDALDRLADDAASRDAGRFATLLEGRVGVGGVYDAWRRLRSRLRGEAFDAAHVPLHDTPRGGDAGTEARADANADTRIGTDADTRDSAASASATATATASATASAKVSADADANRGGRGAGGVAQAARR